MLHFHIQGVLQFAWWTHLWRLHIIAMCIYFYRKVGSNGLHSNIKQPFRHILCLLCRSSPVSEMLTCMSSEYHRANFAKHIV